MRTRLRTRGYSLNTEQSYLAWVRRFYRFHRSVRLRPEDTQVHHAAAFLHHLAEDAQLAVKSRNQAASALSFLLREVLGRENGGEVPHARGDRKVPTVLSHREALRVIGELTGKYRLIGELLYSAGLRLEECLALRIKDVDFELGQIVVREGKGRKDRFLPLADRVRTGLAAQMRRVARLHRQEREAGACRAPLPAALHRKDPEAAKDLAWQFIFPAARVHQDSASGRQVRGHLHATAVQRAVKSAVRRAGITKRASCHTFRHSFATELLRSGCDVRTVQELMGHRDIRTTTIYLHAVDYTGVGVRSPLDRASELGAGSVARPWWEEEAQEDVAEEPA